MGVGILSGDGGDLNWQMYLEELVKNLAALGLIILVIVIFSNVLASMGFVPYFPWTIPGVFQSTGFLNLSSIIILTLTGIAGVVGTFAWWRYAEQP
ncbi:hypothetical protein [Desulfosporosinus nitroreducens]|uniref:Uncharacterized protein n=1 Tax=Desulfosporosinus nitroreducens TaxID=2018668 RepID=A0ABT8QTV6_9FIRM|nr:hypothetical protein [Desulfosporosinus nitroreducens]MDO0823909.1 hypothetical protein [Desulfosporosinus nitroreducens]